MVIVSQKCILILAIVCIFSSCLTFQEVEIIEVVDLNLRELSLQGMVVDIELRVKNPNNYKISVVKDDLYISLNNKDMGKAKIAGDLVFQKHSNDVHKITAKLNSRQLLSAMPLLLSAALGKAIKLEVKGSITAKAKLFRKKINVQFTEKISQ